MIAAVFAIALLTTAGAALAASEIPHVFGTWQVVAHACPHIYAMTSGQADRWIGIEAEYSPGVARFGKFVCPNPSYVATTRTAIDFARGTLFSPEELGLPMDSVTTVNVTCSQPSPWPGNQLLLKNSTEIITSWDGVYFTMRRK
jgi:hypothetical protein